MRQTLLLLASVALLFAQDSTFRARAPLVIVPVSVTDNQNHSIDGLTDADFTLSDNGRPMPVHVDPAGVYQAGVSLVVVIQASGVSKAALLKVRKIGSLIDAYITGADGDAALLSATDQVRLLQDFTADSNKMRSALGQVNLGPDRAGHVLDAVAEAIRMLAAKPRDRRKLVLLISETRDRGSSATPQQVLTSAQQQNVTIYALTYSAYVTPFTTRASDLGPPSGGMDLLAFFTELGRLSKENMSELLTQYTGGRHLSFERLSSLESDLTSIGKEIHSQYLVSFVPLSDPAPQYHRITVTVKDHPQAAIRARPGYWTGTPAQ